MFCQHSDTKFVKLFDYIGFRTLEIILVGKPSLMSTATKVKGKYNAENGKYHCQKNYYRTCAVHKRVSSVCVYFRVKAGIRFLCTSYIHRPISTLYWSYLFVDDFKIKIRLNP